MPTASTDAPPLGQDRIRDGILQTAPVRQMQSFRDRRSAIPQASKPHDAHSRSCELTFDIACSACRTRALNDVSIAELFGHMAVGLDGAGDGVGASVGDAVMVASSVLSGATMNMRYLE
jgi:hypothetical protein